MSEFIYAIQKNEGKLCGESLRWLEAKGVAVESVIQLRQFDIVTMIAEGFVKYGIIGQDCFEELNDTRVRLERILPFGYCRLSLAVPSTFEWKGISDLKRIEKIATSFLRLTGQFIRGNMLNAKALYMSGQVEKAIQLGYSDAIIDLVVSGKTLGDNSLIEVLKIASYQAVVITKV